MRGRGSVGVAVAVSSALAACFSFGDLSGGTSGDDTTGNDAAADGAVLSDSSSDRDTGAIVDASACNLDAPFGPLVMVPEDWDATNGEGYSTLSVDGLTMYFASPVQLLGNRSTLLWQATRSDASAPFGNLTRLDALSVPDATTTTPSLSSDGKILVFSSDRSGGQDYDIYATSRASPADTFPGPVPVTGANDVLNDETPFVSFDKQTLYFASDRELDAAGPQEGRIYRATANGIGFDSVQLVTELVSNYGEFSPVLTPDELTIFFNSSRPPDAGGAFPTPVYEARRASKSDPFGSIRRLSELDLPTLPTAVAPSYVTPDGCVLYVTVLTPSGFRLGYVQRPK